MDSGNTIGRLKGNYGQILVLVLLLLFTWSFISELLEYTAIKGNFFRNTINQLNWINEVYLLGFLDHTNYSWLPLDRDDKMTMNTSRYDRNWKRDAEEIFDANAEEKLYQCLVWFWCALLWELELSKRNNNRGRIQDKQRERKWNWNAFNTIYVMNMNFSYIEISPSTYILSTTVSSLSLSLFICRRFIPLSHSIWIGNVCAFLLCFVLHRQKQTLEYYTTIETNIERENMKWEIERRRCTSSK